MPATKCKNNSTKKKRWHSTQGKKIPWSWTVLRLKSKSPQTNLNQHNLTKNQGFRLTTGRIEHGTFRHPRAKDSRFHSTPVTLAATSGHSTMTHHLDTIHPYHRFLLHNRIHSFFLSFQNLCLLPCLCSFLLSFLCLWSPLSRRPCPCTLVWAVGRDLTKFLALETTHFCQISITHACTMLPTPAFRALCPEFPTASKFQSPLPSLVVMSSTPLHSQTHSLAGATVSWVGILQKPFVAVPISTLQL